MGSNDNEFFANINRYSALVVGSNKVIMNPVRSALKSLGFLKVEPFPTLEESLERAKQSATTHILFDTRGNTMPPVEYVKQVFTANRKVTMIILTDNPALDNVFELIKSGAKGFLLPPPTIGSVESVLVAATSGPPISESILRAEDRNEALATLVLNLLYRTSVSRAEMRKAPAVQPIYQRTYAALRGAMATARMFADGGDEKLREKIIDLCIKRADKQTTRLSEIRKNLKSARVS